MSGWFEWTRIDNQASRDAFYFWERTSQGIKPRLPLNKAVIESWVVGGERGGGPIMVESLPVEAFQVKGIPVYYDQYQDIWFVDGYPDNFASAAEAAAFAESLIPATPPTKSGQPHHRAGRPSRPAGIRSMKAGT